METSRSDLVTAWLSTHHSRRTVLAALPVAPAIALSLRDIASAATGNPSGIPSDAEKAKVANHIDGDKFEVSLGGRTETVLLISADAPEPEECFAKQSGDVLKRLLPKGSEVYLEKDTTDKDGKDRLLRYAWTFSDDKAHLVDEQMISNGYSTFKARADNGKRDDRLKAAETNAKKKGKGIWADGSCGGGHVEITPTPQLGEGGLPAPIGTTLSTDGQEIAVVSGYVTSDLNYSTPKGGYIFLVIYATIKNVDKPGKTHGYDGARFSAKDLTTDANFDDTFAFANVPLDSGELSPGEYVEGEVVLEIQETATRIRIKYDPKSLGDGDEVYWLFER